MAGRRMFARSVIGSARFLRMPQSSRLLYYDLGMAADDDGVVEAFSVMRTTGASEDDLRVLAARQFIEVINDDLVSVILDWKKNNQIRKDRYTPTIYQKELFELGITGNSNFLGLPNGNQNAVFDNQNGNQWETQVRLGQESIYTLAPSAQREDTRNEDFEAFWKAYPRKESKAQARKSFAKVTVPLETLLQALETQKQSDQWKRNGGQYIPYASTWINQRRWEDEAPAQAAKAEEPADNWQRDHPDWADQSTWILDADGVCKPPSACTGVRT